MAISSASTYEEVEAEYLDTLSYERVVSVDMALRHAEACRAMRLKRPSTATKGSNTVGYSAEDLQKAEQDARTWARANADQGSGRSSFVRASFTSLRDRG